MKFVKKIFLMTFVAINVVEQPAPEVNIEQGVLSGRISKDGTLYEYTGIPYATTNNTRFQAPLPAPSWDGVYKAVDEHHSCPQKFFSFVSGEEDCLKINVYVPIHAVKPTPVMVFIHGGAFLMGSGGKLVYSPQFIVEKNVILVTFNYRLGPLGFLCLGINEAPGNAGLKDQVAALRWVKKNIAAFGGDPDNVTIFGESAGGVSTSYMIASNATNGLFNRAIVQSGSSISNWALNRYPLWTSGLLAKTMGQDIGEDPHELYEFFSKAPLSDLVMAQTKKPWMKFFDTELINLPCVEKQLPGVETVVSDLPFNLLEAGLKKNISVMHGFNDREGIFLVNGETVDLIKNRENGYIFASDLEFSSSEEAKATSDVVRTFYFGHEPVSNKLVKNITKLYTEMYFEAPSELETDVLIEKSNITVFNYVFKYSGGRNLVKFLTGNRNEDGACHGDELSYLFLTTIWPFVIKESDRQMVEQMTTMWTNFAKYGNPTPETWPLAKWLPSTPQQKRFMHIGDDLMMGPVPNEDSYKLWKTIYNKYGRKSQ